MSGWRRAGWGAGVVALDVLLPAVAFAYVLQTIAAPLLANPDTVVAAPLYIGTGDGNGEAWFYWWLHRAVVSGVGIEHPDVVCAPLGLDLGNNFPTRIDAWLALPFFHWLPFPRSFNAAAIGVLAANMFAAWLGLRATRAAAPVAVLAAAVVGCSEYAVFDISLGHNANALIGPALCFMGAWAAVAEGRVGWAPVAALAAVLTVYAYPPYALVLAPIAGMQALGGVVRREGRWRRLAGMFVAGVPALLAARSVSADLATRGFSHTLGTVTSASWKALRADSLTWDWPVHIATDFNDHHAWLPPAFLLAGGLALFGRGRGFGWMVAVVYLYVMSLGVVVLAAGEHGAVSLRSGSDVIALPLAAAVKAWPTLVQLRPYRFAPLVAGAIAFAIASATRWEGASGKDAGASVRQAGAASWWRVFPTRWAFATTLATAALGLALKQARDGGHLALTTQPWQVPAAITWLAEQEGDFAIIEMPMGIGQGYGAMQAVHGKRRSDGHHDVSEHSRRRVEPPTECYTDDLVRALWSMERGSSLPADATVLRAGSSNAGFKYVVVYRAAWRMQRDGNAASARVLAGLSATFGAPVRDDGEVAIYAIALP